jgi:hypothetical protein
VATEKWLAIVSIALFVMFVGEMLSVYNFMTDIPEDDAFLGSFSADPKLIQFISIGVSPAGILAGVAFIMSKRYGSKPIGGMIIAGGVILLIGMYVCHSMLIRIDDKFITDSVKYLPILFMVLSFPIMGVGAYLFKIKRIRPKKEYF